jgi:hypothetical protein
MGTLVDRYTQLLMLVKRPHPVRAAHVLQFHSFSVVSQRSS